jgi:hypothetical protein
MIRITYNVTVPDVFDTPQKSARALGLAHSKAGKAAMMWFVRKRLRLRFTGQVQDELQFEPRDPKYDENKKYKGSRGIAHRFTHRTIKQVMSAGGTRIIASARAVKKNVRLIINNLNPGYKRRPDSGRPPMADELRRMTQGEVNEIVKIYGDVYTGTLNAAIKRARKKRKIQ